MTKFTIGQTLWWVPSKGRRAGAPTPEGFEVKVTKVGTKYVTIVETFGHPHTYIFDKRNMVEKNDYLPGRAFLTQADYAAERARRAAWVEVLVLCSGLPWSTPAHVDLGQIAHLVNLLKEIKQ